ncbi:hypothetical protein NM688_g3514 [Phlebia brevispora]|uniref:Uncharacterized protein n=1 Tax=Phlebia brevispora TaxID=194682 RepID=A0ACC1T5D6_9APHY|nr:hypothetical protein NM688_g3514 [Phlebia brevispora]
MPPIPLQLSEPFEKMEEKESLLPTTYSASDIERSQERLSKRQRRRYIATSLGLVLAAVSLALYVIHGSVPGCSGSRMKHHHDMSFMNFDSDVEQDLCPQPAPLTPNTSLWSSIVEDGGVYASDAFRTRAVDWLSGAVQVKTESYDSMKPVGEDPRWEAFGAFHDYLLQAFPLVHSTLKITKVNTYGLVYHWEGVNPSLKPLLLAAHQDVVPVNPDTVDQWTHPPFSGYYDGERIWGRGSSDDKSGLIGILTSIETLLEHDFQPSRGVVLAFGFDEEASGKYGASSIATYLLATYGENSFSMLVDEGGDYMNEYGVAVATVGTGEKGGIDARVEVTAPGGHSSVPPAHTSIGILSALLVELEANPYPPHLVLKPNSSLYLSSWSPPVLCQYPQFAPFP